MKKWILLIVVLPLYQCGNIERPLDSDARNLVDSLSVVGISNVRQEIDSLFKVSRPVILPHLVDSIRKVREYESA